VLLGSIGAEAPCRLHVRRDESQRETKKKKSNPLMKNKNDRSRKKEGEKTISDYKMKHKSTKYTATRILQESVACVCSGVFF
jgi:hypothetical protein